ncbi:glycosyltransferase [Paludicola sp. MB14-C6]|uniref:glycosyltransferase n=1 Tax=Paludihabitans sp. MB14-C6 TaxID=3070656 RepID=UPI0027DE46AE|nr:glycosyltransferase [Paludicola sp. MB14-C6]WMJ24051.1 glycosyltransferase [Paludicola sp. MB14-C6]
MKDKKLLSLCMITYNDEKHLADCLKSVKDIVDEIIIADIGSTDQTTEIATQEGAKVYSVEWKNDFSIVKNLCMEKASGKWVLFLQPNERIKIEQLCLIPTLLDNPNVEAYMFYMDYHLDNFTLFSPIQSIRLLRNRDIYRFQYPTFERIADEVLSNIEDVDIQLINRNPNVMAWDFSLRIQLLHQLILNYSNDSYMQYIYGTILVNEQAYDDSILAFQKAYQEVNLDFLYAPHLFKCFAWLYLITQQLDSALEILNEGIHHFPYYTDFYVLRGELHCQREQYEQAVSDFETCINTRERPNFLVPPPEIDASVAIEALALLYDNTFQYEKALKLYLNAYVANDWNQQLLYKVYLFAKATNDKNLLSKFPNPIFPNNAYDEYEVELARSLALQGEFDRIQEIYSTISDLEKQELFKTKIIGFLLYQDQLDIAHQFIKNNDITLTKEKKLVVWSKQQVKDLLSLVHTMQCNAKPEKTTQKIMPSKSLLNFYRNLKVSQIQSNHLSSFQIHMEIGDYYKSKSRNQAAFTAYLRALLCDPVNADIQDKIQNELEEEPQLLLDCLDSSNILQENRWFHKKQDMISFIQGIIALRKHQFYKALIKFIKLKQNKSNKSLIQSYIASSLWFQNKESLFTDYDITMVFIEFYITICKNTIKGYLSESMKQHPSWGLLKKEINKVDHLLK